MPLIKLQSTPLLNLESTRIEISSKAVITDSGEKDPMISPRRRTRSRSFIVDEHGQVAVFLSPRSVLDVSPRLESPPILIEETISPIKFEITTPTKSRPVLTPLVINTGSALTLNTDEEDSCYSPRSPPRSSRSTTGHRDRSQDLKFDTPPLSPHTEIARRMNHFRQLAERYGSAPNTPRAVTPRIQSCPSFSPCKESLSYDLLKVHRQSTTLSNEQLVAEFSSLFVRRPAEKSLESSRSGATVDGDRSEGIVLKAETDKYQRRRSYD